MINFEGLLTWRAGWWGTVTSGFVGTQGWNSPAGFDCVQADDSAVDKAAKSNACDNEVKITKPLEYDSYY